MTITEIKTDWFNILTTILTTNYSDVTIIFSQGNGPRPKLPYIVLKITNRGKTGMADKDRVDADTGLRLIYQDRNFNIEIRSIGDGSDAILEEIQDYFDTEEGISLLNSYNFAIRNENDILDITAEIDKQYDYQFIYEFTVGYRTKQTEDVGFIETVEIDAFSDQDYLELDEDDTLLLDEDDELITETSEYADEWTLTIKEN